MPQLSLLIIDDDPAILVFIEEVLKTRFHVPYSLKRANSVAEARALFDAAPADIVISDISMPDEDGFDLLSFVKQRNPWSRFIFMTGHSSVERVGEAIAAGASDYLLKPIEPDQLCTVVEDAAERMQRWRRSLMGTFAASR